MNMRPAWCNVVRGIVAVIVVLAIVAGLLLWAADPKADVPFELAKAVVSLIGALIVAGLLGAVLARVSAERASREEGHRALTNTLQDLKAAYERVQVARFYLQARPTPFTLLQQLPTLMESRALLHRVQRDRFVLGGSDEDRVQRMLDYITVIANEYRDNAVAVEQAALEEEAVRQLIRDGKDARVENGRRLDRETFPATTAMLEEDPPEAGPANVNSWKSQAFHVNYRLTRNSLAGAIDEVAPRRDRPSSET